VFTASTQRDFRAAAFSAVLAVDRDFMLHAVVRRGMHHDTRWFPVVRSPARAVAVLWFILAGAVEMDGRRMVAPVVISMSERDYQGADGERFVHYRTRGETFRALEVRVRADALRSFPEAPTARLLDPPTLESVELLWRAIDTAAGAEVVAGRLSTVLSRLSPGSRAVSFRVAPPDPRLLVWEAFRGVYRVLDTASSIKHLAALALGRASSKRMEREVSALLRDYLFPATNWRDITSYTRLGLAAFLLSCPELSIADVAKEVGYAHPTALTNAFAHAGLPAPSTLRELLDPGN